MRIVVQRVSRAAVTVEGSPVGAIGTGLLVLVGVTTGDTHADADVIAAKVVGLRIFADDDDAMNRSVAEVGGSVLVVSQFTLYADANRGRRPSFTRAAPLETAEPLVQRFVDQVRLAGVAVEEGRFGAKMTVELVNDGPVTIMLESESGRLV